MYSSVVAVEICTSSKCRSSSILPTALARIKAWAVMSLGISVTSFVNPSIFLGGTAYLSSSR